MSTTHQTRRDPLMAAIREAVHREIVEYLGDEVLLDGFRYDDDPGLSPLGCALDEEPSSGAEQNRQPAEIDRGALKTKLDQPFVISRPLKLRPIPTRRPEPGMLESDPNLYEVVGLASQQVVIWKRADRSWKLMRIVDGDTGAWEGDYETKEDALAAVEAGF